MPERIVTHDLLELIIVSERMWSRTDQGHFAAQNIKKLGQFINARRSQQPPDAGYSWIVARRLGNNRSVFLNRHGSELQHNKLLAVEAFPPLPKDNRTGSIEFDGDRRHNHDGQQEDQALRKQAQYRSCVWQVALPRSKGRAEFRSPESSVMPTNKA